MNMNLKFSCSKTNNVRSKMRKTKRTASVGLGLAVALLGISFFALLVIGQSKSGERKESFKYYQDGKTGRGRRRVLVVDLGDGIKMEFVRVRAGTFLMGSPPDEKGRRDDEVQHTVELTHDFYLGKYEVTRGQFRAFVNATGYRTEPETDGQGAWGYDEETGKIEGRKPKYNWSSTGWAQTDEHPVVNVTWNDATAFCRWLAQRSNKAMRLPTEAEWEYAARAGSRGRFYSGESPESLVKVGNVADGTAKKKFPDWQTTIAEDGYVFTAPVGQFPPNRFGLHDMLGNVWEWCQDWLGRYDVLSAKDPVRNDARNEGNGVRVMRGGGWGKRVPQISSSALRFSGAPPSRDMDVGFRVAFSAD
jgi:formylglycine-generating enzyme required for sulfatase activity